MYSTDTGVYIYISGIRAKQGKDLDRYSSRFDSIRRHRGSPWREGRKKKGKGWGKASSS